MTNGEEPQVIKILYFSKRYFEKSKGDRRVEEEPGREDQSQGRGGGNEEEGDEREG